MGRSRLVASRRRLDYEAPIDWNEPRVRNPDGSISTERTITVEMDGRYYNLQTAVGDRIVSDAEAIKLYKAGKNPAVGIYSTEAKADEAASARHMRWERGR